MNRLSGAVLFFVVFACVSCGDGHKSGVVLPKEKMQTVLWDMLQADAYTSNFIKNDSSKKELEEVTALQKKIFELHHISREDFTVSYDYYSSRPEQMKMLLDSISAKVERDRNKLMMERYGGMKTAPQ